jgi:hypothetical protein
MSTKFDGTVVEIGEAHRLLELVGVPIGQKDPRHMGLLGFHFLRPLRVGFGTEKKFDFCSKADVVISHRMTRSFHGGAACDVPWLEET